MSSYVLNVSQGNVKERRDDMHLLEDAKRASGKTIEQIVEDSFQAFQTHVSDIKTIKRVSDNIRKSGIVPSYVKLECRRILQERDEAIKVLGLKKGGHP